jgi:hypothetical protein
VHGIVGALGKRVHALTDALADEWDDKEGA